mmetsp:Transcript_10178/g.32121  ORF Transcript_10178/g.32121 Transcript_10178/m.32121 type:complete len:209 (+) Transcript_10178:266-892(+)
MPAEARSVYASEEDMNANTSSVHADQTVSLRSCISLGSTTRVVVLPNPTMTARAISLPRRCENISGCSLPRRRLRTRLRTALPSWMAICSATGAVAKRWYTATSRFTWYASSSHGKTSAMSLAKRERRYRQYVPTSCSLKRASVKSTCGTCSETQNGVDERGIGDVRAHPASPPSAPPRRLQSELMRERVAAKAACSQLRNQSEYDSC